MIGFESVALWCPLILSPSFFLGKRVKSTKIERRKNDRVAYNHMASAVSSLTEMHIDLKIGSR